MLRSNEGAEGKRAKILSIMSVKGGVGKTTVASNLGVSLSGAYNQKTLIIDCDFDLPSVGFHLNMLDPDVTLCDVLDGRFPLDQAVYTHSVSGLDAVLGSLSEDGISPSSMANVINRLAKEYDWIILDTNPALDQNLRNVITLSDEVLIISSPDFPSLSGSLKAIKLAEECGVKVRGIVLNKVRKKRYELEAGDIAETLGHPVLASIPEDSKVNEALSHKIPVVLYAPKAPSGKELKNLAGIISGAGESKGAGRNVIYAALCRLLNIKSRAGN